jgi:aspartyl-tRNA(Asn)/glutamyl-tRNA(Gln) amidotransferase subunit C
MIDNETVKKIAYLSRIKIDDDKLEDAKQEFNGILKWIEQLNEVNTDNVEPLVSVNENTLQCRNDFVDMPNTKEDVLANAPQAQYGYYVVPKVVE